MKIIITLMAFLVFLLIINRLLVKLVIKDKNKRDRLKYVETINDENVEVLKNENVMGKFIASSSESLYKTVLRISPSGTKDRINTNLKRSGLNKSFTPSRWIWLRVLVGLIFPVLFVGLFASLEVGIGSLVLLMLVFILIINLIMSLLIKSKITNRKKQITKDLPDVMDLVTVSVEAGLSFDGAIDRVIKAIHSPVTEEFAIMLKEVRMGKQRKDAMREMSARCNVADMTTLLGSIIQADELGVSVSNILRIQAKQLREKRRQRAREKSLKAPIKLLFPIILFIFPTIFVLLLAPVLISMSEIF